MRNILLALSRLDMRALVTLGPFLDPAEFAAPSNVALERFVPHSAVLLRHASPHTGPRDLCNKTAR